MLDRLADDTDQWRGLELDLRGLKSTLGQIYKRKGNVDNKFLQMCMDTAYAKCTCCTRCGLYCPFGIDTGIMFSYLRGLLFGQGFVPCEMKIGSGMHRIYRAQMDITTEDWVDTCEWMAEEYTLNKQRKKEKISFFIFGIFDRE